MSTPGTLSLNSATGGKPRIVVGSANAEASDNVWVEALVDGASGLSGPGAAPFQLTLAGANAGLFAKGTLTVEGIAAGATATVTIRAWKKDTGADFASATVRDSTTFTLTLGGVVVAHGIPGLPTSIVPGFTGLNLAPAVT